MRPLFPGGYYFPGVFMADSLKRKKSSPLLAMVVTTAVKAVINQRLPLVDVCSQHSAAAKRSRSRCFSSTNAVCGRTDRYFWEIETCLAVINLASTDMKYDFGRTSPPSRSAISDQEGGGGRADTPPWIPLSRVETLLIMRKTTFPRYKA